MLCQEISGTTPDDHAIAVGGRFAYDPVHQFRHCVGINHVKGRLCRQAALKSPSEEGFKKPVIQRVIAFLALLNRRAFAFRQPRNFTRKVLIPQCPTAPLRQFLGNGRSPAAVLPIYRNHFDHARPPSQNYVAAYALSLQRKTAARGSKRCGTCLPWGISRGFQESAQPVQTI